MKLLRKELLLLQSQLLFERHKCELHATRNRRLVGKVFQANAIREELVALVNILFCVKNDYGLYLKAILLSRFALCQSPLKDLNQVWCSGSRERVRGADLSCAFSRVFLRLLQFASKINAYRTPKGQWAISIHNTGRCYPLVGVDSIFFSGTIDPISRKFYKLKLFIQKKTMITSSSYLAKCN